MPAKDKVNLRWQILFILIPIFDIWAFYRIQKLRLFFLMIFLPITILGWIDPYFFGYDNYYSIEDKEWNTCLDENRIEYCDQQFTWYGSCESNWILLIFFDTCDPYELQVFDFIVSIISTFFMIYLIRKWSLEWNKLFSSTNYGNERNPWG